MKKENKKDEGGGSTTVVLKVDMHCEGCTKRIINSVKGIAGLEKVNVDFGNGKLTVIGRVDPIRIRDRVERRTRKKVELISSLPKKKEDNKSENEKKAKEPPVSTVVLKIQLHCEGCTHRIQRNILKIKGVASVCMDTQQDLVTVCGTMEVKTLPAILTKKLKRSVEIASPKKEKKEKDGCCEGGGEKKEKKENNSGSSSNCNKKKEGDQTDQYCYPYPYGYYIEMEHAPQLFSDENPNSCSVM